MDRMVKGMNCWTW